jgi:hypothetical protein
MLRLASVIAVIAVALSAAGALAFAPNFSRVSRTWTRAIVWSGRAFTPVPTPPDSSAQTRDPAYATEGGVPGTFCPIRPHDPNMSVAQPLDQPLSTPAAQSSSTAIPGKTDLLAAPAMCNVAPDTARATSSSRRILP